MKVRVIKEFLDRKCDLEPRCMGEELDLEEDRVNELVAGGYVEKVEPEEEPVEEDEA